MNNSDFLNQYGPVAPLVTGASSGIGKSFAQLLAAKGLNLVLVARRVQRLDELASRLKNEHAIEAKVCQVDLSEVAATQQILGATSPGCWARHQPTPALASRAPTKAAILKG